MPFSDQTLKCKDCGADFVWTAGEQDFYAQKGFGNQPTRCPACRQTRRQERTAQRKLYKITCARCGKEDEVPFEPKGDKEVLCWECYKTNRQEGKPQGLPTAAPVSEEAPKKA